ncbi:restriction endonuclease subunit S [Helicobacter winghamensis]|uniref:restriction endonuclease subunit S n=1 Tax=Helicobacter winghamensis TaxID=157268 RepID=UPI0027A89CDD
MESLSLQSFLQSLHKEQWQEVRLGDITSIIGDGLHGTPNFDVNGECFFINGNNLNDGQIIIKKDTKKVSSIECAKYKKDINEKTILISINGTLGNMALYRGENIMLGKSACYLNFKDNVSRNFMRYVIINNDFQRYLNISATGTTILNVSLKAIRDFTFLLPPLTIQQKIAEILSSFDDKIDLLHRQNKTLESLALTLFRHYFIDNPRNPKSVVGVGESLRGGGSDFAIQAPPSSHQKSGKWEMGKLGDYVRIELGGTPNTAKSEYWGGDIAWINSGEINKFRIVKPTKTITKLGFEKSSTKLLPKGSVVIAITGATLGQVSLLEIDSCANQSVVGVIPNDDFSSEFLYLWIKFNIDEIILNQTGGAQQHINKNDIANYHIIKPDKETLASVNLKTYFEKISHNTKQIQNLQAMRDMLFKAIFA